MSEKRGPGKATRRAPLSRERVVAAALAIVDRDGLEGLTMRALGQELGVDPMAAYHHVPSKAALLDALTEAVLGEISLELPVGAPWRESLSILAYRFRRALLGHPNAIVVVATRPDVSGAALGLIDTALGILLRAGLPPLTALEAVNAANAYIIGSALGELGLQLETGAGTTRAQAADAMTAALETSAYPHLAAANETIAVDLGPDHAFETGLSALLAGFEVLVPVDDFYAVE